MTVKQNRRGTGQRNIQRHTSHLRSHWSPEERLVRLQRAFLLQCELLQKVGAA